MSCPQQNEYREMALYYTVLAINVNVRSADNEEKDADN